MSTMTIVMGIIAIQMGIFVEEVGKAKVMTVKQQV